MCSPHTRFHGFVTRDVPCCDVTCFLFQDKSGTISQTELRQVMQTLGVRCSEPEFKALLENIDTNGDGVVDFEEFCKLLTSMV